MGEGGPVKHAGDESYLQEAASEALGGAEVLAAGIFSWQGLLGAQIAGGTLGAVAADVVSDNPLAPGVGAALGGRAAVEEAAAAEGMTVGVLVAVTADAVVVLDWDGERAGNEVRRFDPEHTDVHVSRFGLSRVVKLHDTESGETFALHGTAAPFLAQAKADKVVMHLLSAG
jgi:hypothetical protein